MRILHVDSAGTWRGGQNQVLLTVQGMAARGHAVALACRRGGVLAERALAAGVELRPLPFRGDLWPPAATGLARVLREWRPDVLQAHDPHAISTAFIAARMAARPRPRTVATRRVDFALRGWFSRHKYRACARVIGVSRAILDVLARAGLSADRLRLVYEGVPDRPPQPGGREALAALGIPPEALVVGNVAALTDHKDHATLLRAAALVVAERSDVHFVILGEGERKPALLELARDLGLMERLAFAGFRQDLDRLIPAFTVFCLSSHMEGLGTSLLDAMAFARPVVATAAGGIPEAVTDGLTGRVVPPRAPEALARALLEVLSRPDLRQSMGQAGRRRFCECFTVDRMVENTLAAYGELE